MDSKESINPKPFFSLKELLRLTKEKIRTAFILLLIMLFLNVILAVLSSAWIFPSFLSSVIYILSIPSSFMISIFFLLFFPRVQAIFFFILFLLLIISITYIFGCYINLRKKWLKGMLMYFGSILVMLIIMYLLLVGYNAAFGHTCKEDNDCYVDCDWGAVSRRTAVSIRLNPFIIADCWGSTVCENHKCATVNLESLLNSSLETDCEIGTGGDVQSKCYFHMADTLNKSELCNRTGFLSDDCYSALAAKLKNVSLCNNVKERTDEMFNYDKNSCVKSALDINRVMDCEKLLGYWRDECYRDAAIKFDNESLCDYLPYAGNKRGACVEWVTGG